MDPLVSIVSLAYNHENYIRQALDGFVMQKTNFEFEIVVHDDASTDNTQKIIREYELKYPNLFKPIYQKENQKSKGLGIVTRNAFSAARGKYIALCEGDDYWTDPFKIQKQVDFLESHPEYSLSFHNAQLLDEPSHQILRNFNNPNQKLICGIEDVLNQWLMATATMMFRKDFLVIPEWSSQVYNGDLFYQLLLADRGPIGYIPDLMSVYRHRSGGLSSISNNSFVWSKRISLLETINQHFEFRYNDLIKSQINILSKELKQMNRVQKYPILRYLSVKKITRFINKLK
jgi:glycosyltransferase involved in cell wall biosynthesis